MEIFDQREFKVEQKLSRNLMKSKFRCSDEKIFSQQKFPLGEDSLGKNSVGEDSSSKILWARIPSAN